MVKIGGIVLENLFFEKCLSPEVNLSEKNLSPNSNFRRAVAPLLLEIELRRIPKFRLRILSPTRR